MTFTAEDLVQLKAALLSGATSISTNGRTVTFQSLKDLKKLIAEIEAAIKATEEPEVTPINTNKVVAKFSKYPTK